MPILRVLDRITRKMQRLGYIKKIARRASHRGRIQHGILGQRLSRLGYKTCTYTPE